MEDSWPRVGGFESHFPVPFILIKALLLQKSLANGRVDIEEWLVYKTQLHGLEWNESLKADPSNLIFSPKSFVMSQQFFFV